MYIHCNDMAKMLACVPMAFKKRFLDKWFFTKLWKKLC